MAPGQRGGGALVDCEQELDQYLDGAPTCSSTRPCARSAGVVVFVIIQRSNGESAENASHLLNGSIGVVLPPPRHKSIDQVENATVRIAPSAIRPG
jgi:hypothetical protein